MYIFSSIEHKEMRFVIPLIPLLFGICANSLIGFAQKKVKFLFFLGLILNIVYVVYQLMTMQTYRTFEYLRGKEMKTYYQYDCYMWGIYSEFHGMMEPENIRFLYFDPNFREHS